MGPATPQTVFPDGCFDLLLVLDGDVRNHATGPLFRGAHVVGPMTRAVNVDQRGTVDVLGVRFRPGRASRMLGVPMAELRDVTVPARELLGPRADELAERVAGTRPFAERTLLVETALASWLGALRVDREDDLLDRPYFGEPVSRLVARSGLSERQVQRRFLRDVGLTPTEVVRLRRFRQALGRLDRRMNGSLSALAAELGYSDHAHFTREFTAFAGCSPSSYVRAHATAPEPGSDLFKRD